MLWAKTQVIWSKNMLCFGSKSLMKLQSLKNVEELLFERQRFIVTYCITRAHTHKTTTIQNYFNNLVVKSEGLTTHTNKVVASESIISRERSLCYGNNLLYS